MSQPTLENLQPREEANVTVAPGEFHRSLYVYSPAVVSKTTLYKDAADTYHNPLVVLFVYGSYRQA